RNFCAPFAAKAISSRCPTRAVEVPGAAVPMIDTLPPSIDPEMSRPTPAVAAARVVRQLRGAADWQLIIGDILELLARSFEGHRAILFRLRDVPGQGFAQSIAAYWVDEVAGGIEPPTTINQAIVNT